jgi:hypothetical protein
MKKTAVPTGMASNAADLLNLQQQDIIVTIETNLMHFLKMAGFLALVPQLVA